MKIIHLPNSVGGNAWGLSRGERALGLKSDVLYLSNSWLQYPADRVIISCESFESCKNSKKNIIKDRFYKLIKLPHIIKEIQRIRSEYDVFHFNFGSTLIDFPSFGLPLVDLPLYKSKGKIVVTYNGCDARQKYPTMKRKSFSACHNPDCYSGICTSGKLDWIRQRKIKKFNKYADTIFALNPDLLYFLPERARFLPYTIAYWDSLNSVPEREINSPITIVHAPTDKGAKGTGIILKTLKKIQKKYQDSIKLVLIEGMPYSNAIKLYAQADVIIDQILIGWYGGLAVESMKMGIPVIAYIDEDDLHFIPSQMAEECKNAIINANPWTLHDVIESIIQDPNILKEKRRHCLEYVNKWHDPRYVARITKEAYEE